jgi:hypothetical protein
VSFDCIKQALKEGKDQYVPISTTRQFFKKRQILPRYIVLLLKEKGNRWREQVKIKTFD